MGTFTRGPMWLQLAQHLLIFWLIHYSEATPFRESTEVADPSSLGCYYNYNHYSEGDRILTNEPCLNCTCHNKMLMCYLRVCPFTKPIGQDCTIEKREDQCCPIITCPEVPVELVEHSSGLHSTSLATPDRYGCHINNQYYAEGSQIPSNPKKPCELCYCIRNMTSCVMQECTLHVENCSPIYNRDVCCPVRYECGRDLEEIDELLLDESTTTVRPTPGFMLTTTNDMLTKHCVSNGTIYNEGEKIEIGDPCENCYCMAGSLICTHLSCEDHLDNMGKQCKPRERKEGQCCPESYDCDMEDETTNESLILTTGSASTESDNINEIEDEGLSKPITDHIDEVDKTTISPLGQRFDASGESSTQSIMDDLSKLQEKLEITTLLYSGFDENIDMNTVVPFKIPGEGSCLIDGVTYTNGSKVPVTNKCDKSCVCLNSILQCIPVQCDEPAASTNCKLIQDDSNLCCPIYDCATERPVSETERSTEVFTETPGVTKSLMDGDENVTGLFSVVQLPTEKELTSTEQPEESATQKESESIQEGTIKPSHATEDRVTTQITQTAGPEDLGNITEAPLQEAKTQVPLAAERGEESTKHPVEEEIAVTQNLYTVGEASSTEGVSESSTGEPKESTEKSTEEILGEVQISTEEPKGENEVQTSVEGLVTESEIIEEGTSASLPKEPIATTGASEVLAEEIATEASVTQKSVSEVAENITEQETTSAPQVQQTSDIEATEKTFVPSLSVSIEGSGATEEPAPVTQQPSSEEEQTVQEEGTTVKSHPSEEEAEKVPIIVSATETPTAEVTETGEIASEIPEELDTRIDDGQQTATPAESHVNQAAPTTNAVESSQVTESQEIVSTPSSVEIETPAPTEKAASSIDTTESTQEKVAQTEQLSLEEIKTESSVTEEAATQKPLPEEVQTEKSLLEETASESTGTVTDIDNKIISPIFAPDGKPLEFDESTDVTLSEDIASESPEAPEILTEKAAAASEEGTTVEARPSEVTEKSMESQPKETVSELAQTGITGGSVPATVTPSAEEIATESADIAEQEEDLTETPIIPVRVIPEEVAIEGSTQETIPATHKPLLEEVKTEIPETITESSEEGTTKESRPSEEEVTDKMSQGMLTESDTESVEEIITATRKPSLEKVQTVVPEIIAEITSSVIEEGTTKESRPSEAATEKYVPEETVSEPTDSIGATKATPTSGATEDLVEEYITKATISPIEAGVQEENISELATETNIGTTKAPVSVENQKASAEPSSTQGTPTDEEETVRPTGEIATEKDVGIQVSTESSATEAEPLQELVTLGTRDGDIEPQSPADDTLSIENHVTEAPAQEDIAVVEEEATLTSSTEEGITEKSPIQDITAVSATDVPVTQKPSEGVTDKAIPEETASESAGSTVTEPNISFTQPSLLQEIETEKSTSEEIVSEPAATEASVLVSQQPLLEEGQTDKILPKETASVPALDTGASATEKPLSGEIQTEKTSLEEIASEPAEGSGVTEQNISATQEPMTEESTAEGSGATEASVSTQELTSEEIQTEKTLTDESASKPSDSAAEANVAATHKPLHEESQTEEELLEETASEAAGSAATEESVSATQESLLEEGQKEKQFSEESSSEPAESFATSVSATQESLTDESPAEGSGATETSVIATQEPASEEIKTEKTLTAESESEPTEASTATEKSLAEETTSESPKDIKESVSATQRPSIEDSKTDRILPEESAFEPAEGSGATVSATQEPLSEESLTQKAVFEETASEPTEESGATEQSVSATQEPLTEVSATRDSFTETSISGTQKPLPEEGQTEQSSPETLSEPAEGSAIEGSVSVSQEPLPEESQTEKETPDENASEPAKGISATEASLSATEKPLPEESASESAGPTETSISSTQEVLTEENLTQRISLEEMAPEPVEGSVTTESSISATQKPLPEESQTEQKLPEETASEPAGSATEASVSATQEPLSGESQTDKALLGETASVSTLGGAPTVSATEKPLSEESQTANIPSDETVSELVEGSGFTEPSISATQELVTEETSAESAAIDASVSGQQKPLSEENQTEKELSEENVSEPAGSFVTEASVQATQKPLSEEKQISTELPEEIASEPATETIVLGEIQTEKPLTEEEPTEPTEQGEESQTEKELPVEISFQPVAITDTSASATQKPLLEESQTDKSTSEETASEPTESSDTTEEAVSVTQKPLSEEGPSNISESITEKSTTVSSQDEKMMTIFDIISPPQTSATKQVEPVTVSSDEGTTPLSEPSLGSIESLTESEGEVTEVPSATEKIVESEGLKESGAVETATDADDKTQISVVSGATEATEKDLEISSEAPGSLGSGDATIGEQSSADGTIPIESHVTDGVIEEETATPTLTKESATEQPASHVSVEDSVTATQVSETQKPLSEGITVAIVEEGTTKAFEKVTEQTIVPIIAVAHEETQVSEDELFETHLLGQTDAPETITEQGTIAAVPEEITKKSSPIGETSKQTEDATEASFAATQKPLREPSDSSTEEGTPSIELEGTTKETATSEEAFEQAEGSTEANIAATQKPLSGPSDTPSIELEGLNKQPAPSDIESDKISESTTSSSAGDEEKFGEFTTEAQKITTIFDIISPPQTIAPQSVENVPSDLTTTEKSIILEEEVTSAPSVGSEQPVTDANAGITKTEAATESSEKISTEEVTHKEEVTASAEEDLIGDKKDFTTPATPYDKNFVATDKAVIEGQVPTLAAAEDSTEKDAVTDVSEGKPETEAQTNAPIINEVATDEAYSGTEKIIEDYVTKAQEATTLSGLEFEQKFGEDGPSSVNRTTTILDIISPTKAPTPVHHEVQTTAPEEDESEKEVKLTTEKVAVTEKETVSTKAPSVSQVTYKPTESTLSEIPAGHYDSGYEPGTSNYPGQTYLEEDYEDETGTCRYGGKLFVSAQQIPRDDPCDFCFCFRSDIICLQQSCPPPINGCHEENIPGFCCPRYECPVAMATIVNVTTSTTTTSTTLPPHFLHHAYRGSASKSGCQINEHSYQVGDIVPSSSGPCMQCICGGDGQMKCEPIQCTPGPIFDDLMRTSRR